MQKRFVDMLRKQFPQIGWLEIQQAVTIAELRTAEAPLAWRMAYFALINQTKKETRWYRRFISIFTPTFIPGRSTFIADTLIGDDRIHGLWVESDEWQTVLRGLPLPARKLAEFAQYEADRFEDVPGGVWTRENLSELRRRIKRDFLNWERSHGDRAYYKARNVLVAALRRNRK